MGFHLFSNSGQIQYGIKNYIADFKTDLKNIPKNPGNMVFVIEESKYYITNNKQDWVEYKVNNSTEESDIEIDITENGSHDVLFATTANVNVPQGVFPEGNQIITENGNYDITLKETVDINVPQGIFPEGTKQINLTSNGTTTEDVTNYAAAEITINTLPAKGLVFETYDSDGYPHSARFVGAWTEIPDHYLFYVCNNQQANFGKNLHSIIIPETVTSIGAYAFSYTGFEEIILPHSDLQFGASVFSNTPNYLTQDNSILEFYGNITFNGNACFQSKNKIVSVIFHKNVTRINDFYGCTGIMLYDFSHCTAIPLLPTSISIGHASGCVIRIPAALSDTTLGEGNGWESATNWSALTDIVWEVV